MKQTVTTGNSLKHTHQPGHMPLQIEGAEYFSAAEVVAAVGVSRVTLWRWRQLGKIPKGSKFRGRQVVFTSAEVAAIRAYALHVEPITADPASPADQLSLFRTGPPRRP
jgi:predicted DNA-binding transcriptional regulator AlpA